MIKINDYFPNISDWREQHKVQHKLADILLIGLCTYLINGKDYEDMAIFVKTKGHLLPMIYYHYRIHPTILLIENP